MGFERFEKTYGSQKTLSVRRQGRINSLQFSIICGFRDSRIDVYVDRARRLLGIRAGGSQYKVDKAGLCGACSICRQFDLPHGAKYIGEEITDPDIGDLLVFDLTKPLEHGSDDEAKTE